MRFILFLFLALLLAGCADRGGGYGGFTGAWRIEDDRFSGTGVVSGTRPSDAQRLAQDIEVMMEDGRIFTIYQISYKERFRMGDRLQIDYDRRTVKRIRILGSIYSLNDYWMFDAD
ncbi:hypothetical protein AGMMS50229_20480 [Campylobacterota bacterium]|nr:hypothetical protein AGMMS50229_20480 [Campylobacterota bacterium]